MPTKEQLHFVSESNLEFGMNGDIPIAPKKTSGRPKGKSVGRYTMVDGKLKLTVNKKSDTEQ